MRRMWILTFRRAIAADDGEVVVIETCGEDELQGAKERLAMQLERDSGEPWRCAEIRAFEAKKKPQWESCMVNPTEKKEEREIG